MFRKPLSFAAGLVAACALTTATSAQIVTFGGNGECKTSTVFFYNRAENKLAGSFEFSYGSPVWQGAHEKATGSMRLGKDGWARLDTSVPLTLGGVKIPAGNWYLGLNKTKDQFSLMVMEAKALRGKMVPPWMTSSVKAKINAPLEHEKVEESQENLLITAAAGKKDPTKCTFTLRWGKHKLTAALVAHLGEKKSRKSGQK
jgi:hypothetical protein